MVHLTVGYVAGFIAAGMFLARLWSPNIVTFILSGFLRDSNSAKTWTVAGRLFQKSHWPWILQSDSTYTAGVPQRILLLSRLMTLLGGLIAVAAVVTPLGLYETYEPAEKTHTSFKHLTDLSPYGYGTPARDNASFTRVCQDDFDFFGSGLKPCPYTDTISIVTSGPLGSTAEFPYGYEVKIPQTITDIYSSGTSSNTTVSNYFDIQWRQYLTANNTNYNNNSMYTVGSFRNMESLILNNAYDPIEGLIVDTKKGSIGFRNHTFPQGFPNGVTWEEDILFIEPETVCIDTNLTLDFSIVNDPTRNIYIGGYVLTDRGGFANINRAPPSIDRSNTQKNPDLYGRAYKAAWLNNAFTALYYNITDPFNKTTGLETLSRMDSFIGKTYSMSDSSTTPNSGLSALTIDPEFGDYLDILMGTASVGQGHPAPSDSGIPTNPFNITRTPFDNIDLECTTSGRTDPANITNIFIACGLIRGIPQRKDGGSNLIPDSGSKWSKPLYSCASTLKATIKTVAFNYSGTSDSLSNLIITDIQDKTYTDEKSLPLWGVENTDNRYSNAAINLIWGLVSPKYENHPNVSTIRQESLYLPGWYFSPASSQRVIYEDNLPGSEFYAGSMATAWTVTNSLLAGMDYSGGNNMAVWARWQNLSSSAETVSLIPNLIFADNAASAVVGTKGVLGSAERGNDGGVGIEVTPIVLKIKYRYLFAIPAFIAAFLLLALSVVGLVLAMWGKGTQRLGLHLRRVSPGRIFTAFLYPHQNAFQLGSKAWSQHFGVQVVDLSGEVFNTSAIMTSKPELSPKPEAVVTETEYVDGKDHPMENERFLIYRGSERISTPRIARKPLSPKARMSPGLGG